MIFEENRKIENVGSILGWICSYLIFTTSLYLILLLKSWHLPYISVMGITMVITLTGIGVKNLLK